MLLLLSTCSKPETINRPDSEPILKIGLIADPQYADKPNSGNRHYKASLWKLNEAIATFNHYDVDFVQTLGDVIDSDWHNYNPILHIYKSINPDIESYHLLGNREFNINKTYFEHLLDKLSMPNYYYSYVKMDWRFIVLDATDYAYFSNSLHNHDINQLNAYYNNTEGSPNHQHYNGAIGEEQQNWLIQELDSAKILDQKVIVFSHMPLRPLGHGANLWNDYEIIDIIENNSNVIAFINGHNHPGNYIHKNDINYITLFGMIESKVNAYAILEIYDDCLVLMGYGNQQSIQMKY